MAGGSELLLVLAWLCQSIVLDWRSNMPSVTSALPPPSSSLSKKPICPCCAVDAFPDDEENLFLPPFTTERPSAAAESSSADALPPPEGSNATAAWQEIIGQACSSSSAMPALVDTHGHPHLEEVRDDDDDDDESLYHIATATNRNSRNNPRASENVEDDDDDDDRRFLSVTCAVAPSDWAACLQYAAQSTHIVAALGVHPWYLPEILDDNHATISSSSAATTTTITTAWRDDLEALLRQHARVLVGEIGLCKVARWVRMHPHGKAAALQLQRRVLHQQLDLAAAYQRPVTVHCVQQHQALLDVLKERSQPSSSASSSLSSRDRLPPAIALHSYTGTAHHVARLLQWEAQLPPPPPPPPTRSSSDASPSSSASAPPPLLYFGVSHQVNRAMCRSEKSQRQARAALQRVPTDRLLVESDVHRTAAVRGGTALACAYLAWALDEPNVSVVAQRTTANARRFLQTLDQAVTEPTMMMGAVDDDDDDDDPRTSE